MNGQKREKNIAIVQLDRLGNLFDSLPAMQALVRENASARIVCFLSEEAEDLLSYLNLTSIRIVSPNSQGIHKVLEDTSDAFDELVNFGRSAESLVLASGLNATKRLGLYLDGENGGIGTSDQWCSFFEAVVGKTPYNPYHAVDVYARIANLQTTSFQLHAPDLNSLPDHLHNFGIVSGVKLVISASVLDSQEASVFLNHLFSRFSNIHVALVGTLRSSQKCLDIAQALLPEFSNRFYNFTGQTTPKDLAYLAYLTDMVITGKGLLGKLAAGFGTYTIFLAGVDENLIEHSPYGHGHLLIQRYAHQNKNLPEGLLQLVDFIIGSGHSSAPTHKEWTDFFDENIENYLNVFRVFLAQRIGTSSTDREVKLKLYPLMFQGYTFHEMLIAMYRLLWNHELSSTVDEPEDLSVLSEGTLDQLRQFLTPLQKIGELAAFGVRYTSLARQYIRKNDIPSAREAASKLQEVDETITVLASHYQAIAPLRNFFMLQQQKISENDALKSTDALNKCYSNLQGQILIFLELIDSLFQQQRQQFKEPANDRP